jgi:hypothetical protein
MRALAMLPIGAALLAVASVASSIAVAQGPAPAASTTTADRRCIDLLTTGVGLTEGRILLIIDSYAEVRAALEAMPDIGFTTPTGDAVPAFLCREGNDALDAAVRPSGFDFDSWASLFTTTLLAYIFATADPAAAASLAEEIGFSPPQEHIDAIRPHAEAFAAILGAPEAPRAVRKFP